VSDLFWQFGQCEGLVFGSREKGLTIKRGATILRIDGPEGFAMSQVDLKNEYILKTQMNEVGM
jgi:hypothetical protein